MLIRDVFQLLRRQIMMMAKCEWKQDRNVATIQNSAEMKWNGKKSWSLRKRRSCRPKGNPKHFPKFFWCSLFFWTTSQPWNVNCLQESWYNWIHNLSERGGVGKNIQQELSFRNDGVWGSNHPRYLARWCDPSEGRSLREVARAAGAYFPCCS